MNTVGASVGVDASGRWRDILDPHLYFCLVPCSFVTHPHSSQRKNAYYIHPPGERDRINFVKYCWLYSSISLRNQSLFPEEHFPSHARKINPLAVYSIRPTISPVTSPLYLYIVGFFCFAIVIIPFFFNVDNGFKSSSLRSVLFQENHFFLLEI